MSELVKQVCFVDMPFGKKHDPKSGVEIDFDQIYEQGIEPAIISQGLQAVRADRELTGGIIHTAMFARLLLAEFVIADMTTANPNVFYEQALSEIDRLAPLVTFAAVRQGGEKANDLKGEQP